MIWATFLIVLISLTASIVGCTASAHRAAVSEQTGERLTVGTVQREIRVGMNGGEVIQVLNSPNIVSTDEHGHEVWIYDKISTEHVHSRSSGGGTILILGYGQKAGARSSSQRTLTIVIKFNEQKKVRDFAYHTSRF